MSDVMIHVEGLSKSYGSTHAIEQLSFTVNRGEIVGFLGPNGAGKSTTMRILTGAQGANAGIARVGGIDVFADPRGVKRLVGYLPEVPPLYTDMAVRDYLLFCARIKGAADPRAAVERVIGRIGLSKHAHRLIDHLSKGYRQRVGIAQAIVHSPKLLILDEPTSGLDPAQRVEIRGLIRELAAGDTTVVLSTHVLPEIEAICDRVVIIHHGKIVAQDTVERLSQTGNVVRLQLEDRDPLAGAALAAVDGVLSVEQPEPGLWVVRAERDVRRHVAAAAVPYGLIELSGARGLEDVFLQLTGEAV